MYSEIQHIFFSSMSSTQELFLIKDDQEDPSHNFEIVKRPTLNNFQIKSIDHSLSSSSESHFQGQKEENINDQEKGYQSDSEAITTLPSSSEDGFRTPTCLEHRIPVTKQCPAAPRKPKPSMKKRKASHDYYYSSSRSHPLDLSGEVELLFPTQSTKKVRTEQLK